MRTTWTVTGLVIISQRLELLVRRYSTGQQKAIRGQIVLLAADGKNKIEELACEKPESSERPITIKQMPILNKLILDKESPQETGTVINCIAQAYDAESYQLFYQFLLNGTTKINWSP
ncbi:MAG: hypothetical protein WA137_09480 [Methanothrix sp.]|jgi:hypothetical protein|nr:hypothetical protein [Methanothrix sp.]